MIDPTEPYQGDDIDIEIWGYEFGYEEDEVLDAEISAGNWCECGLPRAACHLHNQSEDT